MYCSKRSPLRHKSGEEARKRLASDSGAAVEKGRKVDQRSKKKEPHVCGSFNQTSKLAQGRPAGLVATLLAAVLPA